MDATAIAIPIPVQPIQPPPAKPGPDAPPQDGEGMTDFASALEQQISQAPVCGARPAHVKALATEGDEQSTDTATAEARDPHGPTPDGLIALMSAPPLPACAGAAQPRVVAGPPGAIRGPHADCNGPVHQRQDAREYGQAKGRDKALETAAADGHCASPMSEHEAAPKPIPSGLMNDAAIAPAPVTPHALAAPAHAAAPSNAHDARIDAPVGSADWGNGLAQQVTVMVKDGEHSAQLRLDPPDLGPLEVRLSMVGSEDGVAHAQFVSPHAAVRDALEAALPQLRALLADNGITLGQASVGEGFVRDDARGAQQSSDADRSRSARGDGGITGIGAPRTIARHGLVDTFA